MRAWLEIDLDRLRNNYQIVRQQVGSTVGIIAVVKSNAYGIGIKEVVEALDGMPTGGGVEMFAVVDLNEAFQVRTVSQKPVLILGYVDSKDLIEAIENDFILNLYDKSLVPFYERVAARLDRTVRVHVKLDTGLNRLGMSVDDAADFLVSSRLFPHLSVEGIFSHLATPADSDQNNRQLACLHELLVKIQGKTDVLPIHLVSSQALANCKEGYFDAVRVGLALYGTEPVLPGLELVYCCKSVVMQVKTVLAGEGVGYGHLFKAERETTVAVVAIGYGEGLSQLMTGQLEVLIQGQKVPVIGQISMNVITADVTDLGVKRGEEVVIIGSQKGVDGTEATISPAELAKRVGIRHHELMTRLGVSLPKFYRPRYSGQY